jgi:hypothetical protein
MCSISNTRLVTAKSAMSLSILYEDEAGDSIFEYDQPSSLFGQYGDERVTEVGHYFDAALEATLRDAVK